MQPTIVQIIIIAVVHGTDSSDTSYERFGYDSRRSKGLCLLSVATLSTSAFLCVPRASRNSPVEMAATGFTIGLIESLVPETTNCFRTDPQIIESDVNLTSLRESSRGLKEKVDKADNKKGYGRLVEKEKCGKLRSECDSWTRALHSIWTWFPQYHDWQECARNTNNLCKPNWGPFSVYSVARFELSCVPNESQDAPDRSCQYYTLSEAEKEKARTTEVENALGRLAGDFIPVVTLANDVRSEVQACLKESKEFRNVEKVLEILAAEGTVGMAMTGVGVGAFALMTAAEDAALVVSIANELSAIALGMETKSWELVGRNLGAIALKVLEVVEVPK